MKKNQLLYSGKAKSLYFIPASENLLVEFRDDATAFNGKKLASFPGKGILNNAINAFLMSYLNDNQVPTHFNTLKGPQFSEVNRLEMIPVECVLRNISAGGLCRRLGIEEGKTLEPPLYENFLKNDELGDPLINEAHAVTFGWATAEELEQMKALTYRVNKVLKPLFAEAGLLLVDFKLEFGRYQGQLVLGDEITPDGCRIWDIDTREKLDKDCFRYDLGNIIDTYRIIARRLGVVLPPIA